eukprot:1149748-Pelagomonas_calceolata.AAC.2
MSLSRWKALNAVEEHKRTATDQRGKQAACSEHGVHVMTVLGLDQQCANKRARKLHAHSVMYANKLVTTRHAIENNDTPHNLVLEPDASSIPPDPDPH